MQLINVEHEIITTIYSISIRNISENFSRTRRIFPTLQKLSWEMRPWICGFQRSMTKMATI